MKRVFDRRGRSGWDEETRTEEDRRLTERRRADRRTGKARRVAERRQKDTWADDPEKQSRRKQERRAGERRSGTDRRKELAARPRTFVHELVSTSGAAVQNLPPHTRISDAIALLSVHKIGLVVISTPEKGLLGVLSERDIIRAFHKLGASALEAEVAAFMTRGVWTCAPGDRLRKIISTMSENKMRHMPVVHDGQVVGVVSASDLLNVVLAD